MTSDSTIYTVTFTDDNNTRLRIISEKDKSPTLKQAQDFIGGYITMAPVHNPIGSLKCQLLVNEEGEPLKLPLNTNATRIAGYSVYGDCILLKGKACWD